MKNIWKECESFKKDDFYQFVRDEYDNVLISYGGRDYMFDIATSGKGGDCSWYLMDAIEFLSERRPKPLAGPFDSLDSLLAAPVLNGESIDERYCEIEKSDTFRLIES